MSKNSVKQRIEQVQNWMSGSRKRAIKGTDCKTGQKFIM